MKSAVFYGKHDMRVENWDKPVIDDNEILVQVKICGICGTDVHIYEGDKGAATTNPPCILGHEFAGIVVEAGKNVKDLQVGDRVCIDPNDTCNECYFCKSGLAHYCENMIGYGTTTNGGFAEFCKVHYKQAYKVSNDVTFAEAAMAEPLSCCIHGIDMCDIHPGSTVLVIGGGMIGLLTLQLALLAGAANVILSEPVATKREMAKNLGATIVVDPIHEDIKAVLDRHQIKNINTVIECCGLKSTIAQALDLVGMKGTVMMFGLTKPDDEVAIKPFSVFQKETTIRASFINPYTIGRAVELIKSKRIDVSSMVCETIPLEKLGEYLADPAKRAKGKILVNPEL